MKVRDAHILFVPGFSEPAPDHWQWRWRQKLSTGRFVLPGERDRNGWVQAISEAVNGAERPAVIVAHGHGIAASLEALPAFRNRVAGAFFAGPREDEGPLTHASRLPFPTIIVGSRNDPSCPYVRAEALAERWGALLLDAGEAGHIDVDAGFGPWPEGSIAFAQFLVKLS